MDPGRKLVRKSPSIRLCGWVCAVMKTRPQHRTAACGRAYPPTPSPPHPASSRFPATFPHPTAICQDTASTPPRLGSVAEKTRRDKKFDLRLTQAELARVKENAAATGLGVSEYIRRRTCGELRVPAPLAQRPERADDFEARVRELERTMPRANAELLARRERAKAKARAALASA
jgi:Mobilization protein NikA